LRDATSLPVANAEFSLRDARKAVLKPPHYTAMRDWRDHQASSHLAKRLDSESLRERAARAFTAAFSLVIHSKLILAAAVFSSPGAR
jgi:hypothetical protein